MFNEKKYTVEQNPTFSIYNSSIYVLCTDDNLIFIFH